jgi:hypothetical protein
MFQANWVTIFMVGFSGQGVRFGKHCLIGASVKAFRWNSNSKSWFIKGALSWVCCLDGLTETVLEFCAEK